MRTAGIIATAATALAGSASAVGVSGTAEGFAASTTGGGSATPVYPADIDELVSYLGDDQARVIVLDTTFDFTGSEGTVTETGCAPWGTGSACQTAINQNDWCTNYEPDAPSVSVTYDVAGVEGITVGSNKSLIGVGSSGVIKGKGLRMANGVSNVIIQNIHITDLNPQYVWGGDAITLDGTDLIWIDHVKTSLIGRQHIVLGEGASQRVTISNNEIDGTTDWSATCDGQHYWNLYFTGSSDLVTFKGNYIHNFSGRAPKVGGTGNSLIHAVNNYFYSSTGHAFEISTGGMVLAEGNLFQDVDYPLDPGNDVTGQLFSSPDSSTNAVCSTYLGRSCVVNSLSSSGDFYGDDEDFLVDFEGKNIASASAASSSPVSNAGIGKI